MVEWNGRQTLPDQEAEQQLPERQAAPKKWEVHYGAVFLYQATLCIAVVVLLALMQFFYPQAWRSIDRYLQTELSRNVNFKDDGERAAAAIQHLLPKHEDAQSGAEK